jgi:hypothetical protein
MGPLRLMKARLKEVWPKGYPKAAICVQRFDDSLNSAIRITYRISQRSSSLQEPRHPLLRVVHMFSIKKTFNPNFLGWGENIKLVIKFRMVK